MTPEQLRQRRRDRDTNRIALNEKEKSLVRNEAILEQRIKNARAALAEINSFSGGDNMFQLIHAQNELLKAEADLYEFRQFNSMGWA